MFTSRTITATAAACVVSMSLVAAPPAGAQESLDSAPPLTAEGRSVDGKTMAERAQILGTLKMQIVDAGYTSYVKRQANADQPVVKYLVSPATKAKYPWIDIDENTGDFIVRPPIGMSGNVLDSTMIFVFADGSQREVRQGFEVDHRNGPMPHRDPDPAPKPKPKPTTAKPTTVKSKPTTAKPTPKPKPTTAKSTPKPTTAKPTPTPPVQVSIGSSVEPKAFAIIAGVLAVIAVLAGPVMALLNQHVGQQ